MLVAGVCKDSRQVHLATDAFLAVLDSTPHSKEALELFNSSIDWHVYLTRAQTEAAKPDSPEWLIIFLNMSACVARLCGVEAESGAEEPQPESFAAAILQRNTLEVVCNSILQAVQVTNHVIIKHCSCMLMLHTICVFCSQLMLTFTGSHRPGLVMTYIAAEALILPCTFR